jgi:hypothetical protein
MLVKRVFSLAICFEKLLNHLDVFFTSLESILIKVFQKKKKWFGICEHHNVFLLKNLIFYIPLYFN